MRTANWIYAGGEFTRPRDCGLFSCGRAQTGCAEGGYGLDGTLPWQRATSQFFRTAYTVQSSFIRNDFKHDPRWLIGDVPNGFWVRSKAC